MRLACGEPVTKTQQLHQTELVKKGLHFIAICQITEEATNDDSKLQQVECYANLLEPRLANKII